MAILRAVLIASSQSAPSGVTAREGVRRLPGDPHGRLRSRPCPAASRATKSRSAVEIAISRPGHGGSSRRG